MSVMFQTNLKNEKLTYTLKYFIVEPSVKYFPNEHEASLWKTKENSSQEAFKYLFLRVFIL